MHGVCEEGTAQHGQRVAIVIGDIRIPGARIFIFCQAVVVVVVFLTRHKQFKQATE